MRIIHLDTVDSTNRYCELLDLTQVEEFTIVCADEQTAGRGQQQHTWESERGKNITFSLVLHPDFLPIGHQYQLNKAVALGIADYLRAEGIADTAIKWPNDIYAGSHKICGTLIANKLKGGRFESAICGIGLNVNQTRFSDWIPNPTSMQLCTRKEYDTAEVLVQLTDSIAQRYQQLHHNDPSINNDYLSNLLNLNREATYRYHEREIRATITDVNRYGHLMLNTREGEEITCQLGEIQLVR